MELPSPPSIFQERYQLEDILGEGGFAIVFRAMDLHSRRVVAIKVLKPEGASYAPGTEPRFVREVRVLAQLRDPHTITMFDYGQTASGLLYMVFEFVPGRDLADLLSSAQQLEEAPAMHILLQVLHSLREAHAAGLLHRDIKPENIRIFDYMGDPLTVKVLDFGIARAAREEQGRITKTGASVGTPRYMSPEQLLGAPLTPSSDLYSVGLVAFEMLMGRAVVDELNRPSEQLKRMTSQRSIELPAAVAVSPNIRSVLNRLLQVQSENRFQSVDEVLAALEVPTAGPSFAAKETLRAERVVGEAPTTVVEEVVVPDTAVADVPEPATEESPPLSIRPMLLVTAGAVVSIALLAGVVIWLQPAAPAPPPPEVPRVALHVPPAVVAEPDEPDVGEAVADAAPSAKVVTGCGQPAPLDLRRSATSDFGLSRVRFTIRLPDPYDPNVEHPLMLLLHNSWQGPDEFMNQSGFEPLADEEGIILVAPEGDEAAVPWMLRSSVGRAEHIAAQVTQQYCVDPDRLYVVGFGAGGRLAEKMACESHVAGIATLAFRPERNFTECQPAKPVPYIMLTGVKNEWHPVGGGKPCSRMLSEMPPVISLDDYEEMWRKRQGCSGKPKTFGRIRKDSCSEWTCEKAPFAACRLQAGLLFEVHVPEVPLLGDYNVCNGQTSRYPIAKTVWEFFETHEN